MASQKPTTTRSALADELILYTTKQEGEKVGFSYEAECTALKSVTLTLNFDGSANFAIDDYGGNVLSESAGKLCLKAVIRPFTRHFMGRLAIADRYKRASLKMGCSWTIQDAADNETESYMQVHIAKIQKEISNSKTVGYPRAVFDPMLSEIQRLYNSSGQKFVDLDFPPLEVSLFKREPTSSSLSTSAVNSKAVKHPSIEWKRAYEFLITGSDTTCKVFEGRIEPADIRQGALGDCWFLCALAAIAEFPQLVKNLIPHLTSDSNNHGAYVVQFCKMGIWTPIRVDDFFPCYPGGGAIYSRGHGPEMWVLLLEKAFAKYCGSYEAIKSGWAFEAMIDLTGAPFENYRFSDADVADDIKSGKLWTMLEEFDSMGYLISASTPGEDVWTEFGKKPGKEVTTGLVAGHAYTIIKAKHSKYGPRLVKLRNPWGSMEWTGDWSDKSPLWTKEMQDDVEQLLVVDDGTFWMSYEDMVKYFNGINICMVRGIHSDPWFETRRRFFYSIEREEKKVTSNNYVLTVSEPGGTFFFSVHQQDVRGANKPPYVDIGVTVLQEKEQHSATLKVNGASDESRKHKFIGGSGIAAARQNQFKIELSPGTYIVAPVTTGCKLEAQVAEYNQKKGSAPPKKLLITDATGKVVDFTDDVYRVYTEIFYLMDVDTDGFLSKDELDHFMVLTEGKKVSDEAFAWLVTNFGEKRGISLEGFLRAQLFVLQQVAADEEKLRSELALLGYDGDLTVPNRREASLVIHSAAARFTLETRHYDPVVYEDATELVIRKNGKVTAYDGGKVLIYVHKSGYNGVSFLIENASKQHPLIVKCDCSKSKNVVSHRGSLSHEETIAPGADVVMHHLMPANDREGWTWTYSLSYAFDD